MDFRAQKIFDKRKELKLVINQFFGAKQPSNIHKT